MVCRVTIVGHPDWLESDRLREVRRNRRIECVGTDTLDSLLAGGFDVLAGILLLQFLHDFDCCIATVQRVRESGHDVRCVAVTGDIVEAEARRIVAAGSWGQLLESAAPGTYCQVITQVAAGRLAYPTDILNRIETSGGRMTLTPKAGDCVERLTSQEQDLIKLLADGLTTTAAARAMGMTPQAARRLRRNLMSRLSLRNRAMLVRYAIRAGLVEL